MEKSFAEFTDGDLARCASALWDIRSGDVLYVDGVQSRGVEKACPTVAPVPTALLGQKACPLVVSARPKGLSACRLSRSGDVLYVDGVQSRGVEKACPTVA